MKNKPSSIADDTRGFSGREIEKLFVAVQAVAYGSGGVLDLDTFLSVVHGTRWRT